ITDAVVVAWILNATLFVLKLDHQSFWKNDSDFLNIFDVDWFISYLRNDTSHLNSTRGHREICKTQHPRFLYVAIGSKNNSSDQIQCQ
ncbi:unnamed protein product, partial [Coffea canephora]